MTINTYINMEEETPNWESEFVKTELRIQRKYAEKLKSATVAEKVYLFESSGYFSDAETLLMCDVTVKMKNGKYAVLSEAAQNTLDLTLYQQWSVEGGEDVHLGVDDVGCFL